MAYQIPTTEPEELVVGDSWKWKKTLADYPASDGWVLSYAFRSSGKPVIDITSSADGDDHSVSVAATGTVVFQAGTYHWQSRVTKGADVHTIATGRTKILSDLSASDPSHDPRFHVEKVLAAIEANIEGIASKEEKELEVGGLRLSLAGRDELIRLRSHYIAELKKLEFSEALRNKTGNPRRYLTRFTRS